MFTSDRKYLGLIKIVLVSILKLDFSQAVFYKPYYGAKKKYN